MPDEVHPADRSSTWGMVDFATEATDGEETLRKPEAKHFRLRESHLVALVREAILNRRPAC